MTIRVQLPVPPSVNHYWRHVVAKGRVRVLVSAAGRQYKASVGARLMHLRVRPFPAGSRLTMHAVVTFPDRRACDLDNRLKSLLDAMQGYAYADDAAFDRITIERAEPNKDAAGVTITIQQVETP